MNTPLLLRACAASLLLLPPATGVAIAESTPEARQYLSKLSELAEKRSFRADYSLEASTSALGQSLEVRMSGQMTQADRAHLRTTMTMTMTGPAPAEGGEDVKITLTSLVVADGSTMWTEMDNPMMGGKQVLKIGLDQLNAPAAASSSEFQRQLAGLDPVSQMQRVAKLFDFAVAARDEDKVTLRAPVTPEGLGQLGIAGDVAAGVKAFVIELDLKTGFVREVRIEGDDEPVMVMRITNFETLDPARIEPGLFSYTPPEGINVVDLATAAGG